jgi:uncharacterized protein (DUF305 family)
MVGMMKTLTTSFLAALVVLPLSACTINIDVPDSSLPHMMDSGEIGTQSEVMFAQMMIPHHQQAIDMSYLALANSSSEDVRDLAERIIAGQSAEIEIMRSWSDADTVSGMMPGSTMGGMGGMATEAEVAELATLEGDAFDTEFLTLMITHHEGALVMVRMIDGSRQAEAAQLAEDIIRVQSEEIIEMTTLLETLNNA